MPGPAANRWAAARPPVRSRFGSSTATQSAPPITVAGILGHACNSSRIRGSTASTTDPVDWRRYAGGASAANAVFTVFFDHPTARAITLIDIRSDRYSRRISAQSSTLNTHILLTSAEVSITEGVRFSTAAKGSVSRAVDRRSLRARTRIELAWPGWKVAHDQAFERSDQTFPRDRLGSPRSAPPPGGGNAHIGVLWSRGRESEAAAGVRHIW